MNPEALIIIDMLNDFICPEGALFVGETVKRIIPEIQKKIAHAHEEDLPVIYICDSHDTDDEEFKMFPQHCVTGQRGAEIHKDLRPSGDDIVITKKRFSGFFETELDDILKKYDVKTLELCGVCTNICILFSAADARARGYDVVVDRRCVDSFDHAAHEFALKEMDRVLGVKII